jgi:fructokinase
MKIVSIGEILWDIFPEGERLGGATFNFSAQAAALGHHVTFISAVGRDRRGEAALNHAKELGVNTDFLQPAGGAATGTVEVRLESAGQPAYRLIRPAAFDAVNIGEQELRSLAALAPDWIYYGTLHQICDGPRDATRRIIEAIPAARRFYDVNLRPDSYSRELVLDLAGAANVIKCNEDEAAVVAAWLGMLPYPTREFCAALAARFSLAAVCITRGERGCAVWADGEYAEAPAVPIKVVDAVGAGDAFAAAFLDAYHRGCSAGEIGRAANYAGALAVSRSGAIAT